MVSQADKARRFKELHDRPGTFIIPNPWDAGSARILSGLGFEALATTSAGLAFSLGVRDTRAGREATLENARTIVQASDLPVSADLENGFADDPEAVAEIITLAAETGLVGGSIEDATARDDEPIYDLEFAVERVRAAVERARSLPFPFTLTARAENFLHGRPDLGDTILRLQRFQEAGADVLYAPGLRQIADIRAVVAAVDRPINVLMGAPGVTPSLAELTSAGVRRVSAGSALHRAAFGAFITAARGLKESGSFEFMNDAVPFGTLNDMF